MIIYLQMLETPEEKSKFEQLYLEYKGLMFHVAYDILHNEHLCLEFPRSARQFGVFAAFGTDLLLCSQL